MARRSHTTIRDGGLVRAQADGATFTGRREHNEDTYCIEQDVGLFLVADGMGGYEGGELASGLVRNTIRDFFRRGYGMGRGPGFESTKDGRSLAECRMEMAIRLAHRGVIQRSTDQLSEMGSTVAALLIHDDRALTAHVGDSRVYRYRNRRLQQLTRDHSLLEELQAEGAGGLQRAAEEGLTHVVTRAITKRAPANPDMRVDDVRSGDRFLLCSDGLTESLHDDVLANLLRDEPLERVSTSLVELAYRAGSQDNITAVTVETV